MIKTPYDRVKTTRNPKRPTGLGYIGGIFEGFFQLHGDRRYADDGAIAGGVAMPEDTPVTVIAIEKGRSTKERAPPGGLPEIPAAHEAGGKIHRPVICFIDTSGAHCGSGGALALAVADRVWMLENAVYSVISPEGCASILWQDAAKAPDAAANLKLNAQDALTLSVIERMISEKDLGQPAFYAQIRTLLTTELAQLAQNDQLLQQRYERFRRIGAPAR